MRKNAWTWVLGALTVAAIAGVVAYAEKEATVALPKAVESALTKAYPGATITESEIDVEGIRAYEVELEASGDEVEVTVAADGTIMEVETEIGLEELPSAVKAALVKAAAGAKIEEIVQEETLYVVTLKKLDKPEISYEAEVIRNGREIEVELAADGTILEEEADEDDDGDDDHDGDEDDDDA